MICDQLIDIILAIGRVTVLILGTLGGIFSIYLGWNLYKDTVRSKTSSELTFKSLRLVLVASGPGVFLAVFGTYLLYSITMQRLDLGVETQRTLPHPSAARPSAAFDSIQPKLMPVAGIENSKPAVNLPTPSNAAADCTIFIRRRSLAAGQDVPPPEIVTLALDAAIEAVRVRGEADSNSEKRVEYARTVAILRQLRTGVVK